jgi:hypothetical protein
MTRITPSEDWPGFTFKFSNGWSVSMQQGEAHYCTVGKTAEVAVFDSKDNWYVYDEDSQTLEASEADTYVNGHLDADAVAKIISIISIISQEKIDIRTSK